MQQHAGKPLTKRTLLACGLAGMLTMALPQAASAQAAWPERPITLVVGYAPGGQSDMHARILAKRMSATLGQQVVIENKPGAGTTLAAEYTARARPDGYTIFMAGGSALTIAPHTYSSVRYKADDFQTISLTSYIPVGLIINPQVLPVKDFKEFVAWAKANPNKFNYATTGPGGASHLLGELIKTRMGIDIVPVHYKGAGPALQDVLAGRVQGIVDSLPPHLPHIAAGKELGLGISSEKRLAGAPQVPTFIELGYPELAMGSWNGIVVPKGTPQPVVDKLYRAVVEAASSEEFRTRVTADAIVPAATTPAEFDAIIKRDFTVWGDIVKKVGGIKLD